MEKRVRYTVNDVNNNEFYQMPKFLFEGEFKTLSNDARVLYSLLRDRHKLSLTNGWVNDQGEVYLIYKRESMMEMLGCSQPTVRKAVEQLKEHGLMEEEKKGFNRPNFIYLTAVDVDITGVKKSFTMEGKNLSLHNEKIFHNGVKKSFTMEGKNLSPNQINHNQTNINQTEYQSINRSDQKKLKKEIDMIEKVVSKKNNLDNQSESDFKEQEKDKVYSRNRELVARNIDYEVLIQNNNIVEDILTVIAETISSNKNYVRVGREQRPVTLVKEVLLKLNSAHIKYVLDFVDEERLSKVKNKKAYILTTLYKSYGTIKISDAGQQKKDESKNISKKESSKKYKEFYNEYRQIIADNIEYETIKHDDNMVENILELMTDIVTTRANYVRIGKEEKPTEVVKAVFLKLRSYHIQYVVGCMKSSTQKINNIKAYITTALYNAPATIEAYYANQVQHDLYNAE